MFTISITPDSSELDPDYHHVHHATILRYLERARLALLETAGFPQPELFARDLFLVISEIAVEYLREVRDEEYLVTCDTAVLERKRLVLDQRVVSSKGKDAVRAKVTSMCLSRAVGRAVVPPADLMEGLERVMQGNKRTP